MCAIHDFSESCRPHLHSQVNVSLCPWTLNTQKSLRIRLRLLSHISDLRGRRWHTSAHCVLTTSVLGQSQLC